MRGNTVTNASRKLEAEQSLIGACLFDGPAFEQVVDVLSPEHFSDGLHQKTYAAMQQLYAKNEPIELFTVLPHVGEEHLGYLGKLARNVTSARNVAHYARVVRDADVERRLKMAGELLVSLADDWTQDLDLRLDQAEQALFAVREAAKRKIGGPRLIKQALLEVVEWVDERFQRKPGTEGFRTGLLDLDRMLSGLQPGDLVLIGGRPSTGKTALAMQFAQTGALRGDAALVFSLEMSDMQLAMRAIANASGVSFRRLRSGDMQDDDWPRMTAGVSALAESPIIVDDSPGLSLLELRARARRAARQHDLKLLVVDYLQLMVVDRRAESRHLGLAEISGGLKGLAKELKVPIIALSQLNRDAAKREPGLESLRDSGGLEADADIIMLLHRDSDEEQNWPVQVLVKKQRNGPTGKVTLLFRGDLCRFENYAADEMQKRDAKPQPWRGGFDG
jgi:replicative DNA helicase